MKKAFKFSARRRLPRLAARLLYLVTFPLLTSKRNGPEKKRFNILALSFNKSGFLQDVEESFSGTDEFDIVGWPAFALRSIASEILVPGIDNNNYMSDDPEMVASKEEYRAFLTQMWRHLTSIRKIDAVVSPNFHYCVQRELAAVLEEANTPFIVLHKENLKSVARAEFWRFMYKKRGTFSGRKILVYNEIERELQVSTSITGKDRIVISGMPRLDRVHRWRRQQTANGKHHPSQVLFFAFHSQDKLPQPHQHMAQSKGKWDDLSWSRLCEKTHRAIIEFAIERPDVRVVIKTKGLKARQEESMQMLLAVSDPLPSNVTVVCGGDPFKILTESSVVVGFNTTGQLEAIAAGKPVIVPAFDEALAPKTRDFVIELGEAVEYARSPEELVEIACRLIDHPKSDPSELTEAGAQALIMWTGNDDGLAGRRVLEAIYDEIPH